MEIISTMMDTEEIMDIEKAVMVARVEMAVDMETIIEETEEEMGLEMGHHEIVIGRQLAL